MLVCTFSLVDRTTRGKEFFTPQHPIQKTKLENTWKRWQMHLIRLWQPLCPCYCCAASEAAIHISYTGKISTWLVCVCLACWQPCLMITWLHNSLKIEFYFLLVKTIFYSLPCRRVTSSFFWPDERPQTRAAYLYQGVWHSWSCWRILTFTRKVSARIYCISHDIGMTLLSLYWTMFDHYGYHHHHHD